MSSPENDLTQSLLRECREKDEKMKKIIVIEDCTECPFFQDAYVPYGRLREHCLKARKDVPWIPGGNKNRGSYPIPNFCPLESVEEFMLGEEKI